MADTTAEVLNATPYAGFALPGKCVLSPEMEMLDCRQGGDEDSWAFDIIKAHAAAQ